MEYMFIYRLRNTPPRFETTLMCKLTVQTIISLGFILTTFGLPGNVYSYSVCIEFLTVPHMPSTSEMCGHT